MSFQAFRYRSTASRDVGYVVTMRLPRSLPEFYAFTAERPRSLVQGTLISEQPFVTVAADAAFGHHVLAAIAAPLQRLPGVVDLSIDHDQLVALNVPRKADEFALFVDALAEVYGAILTLDLASYVGEPPPQHLSFYRHPDWVYLPRDDSFLPYVLVERGGKNHEAIDVTHSPNDGLPFISLTHTWQTEHSSTDANGNTTTYRRNHSEEILEFRAPFPFRAIGINGGAGERVRFESEAFNKEFKVHCSMPRFASDVLHPRQLEYLLRAKPYPFQILNDGRVIVTTPSNSQAAIEHMSAFLRGFFARVPDFTWKELGAWPRPIPAVNYSE